jgi:hypothetical protein
MSRKIDLWILAVPLVVSLLSLLTLAGSDTERAVPLWAFLLLIVAFDVSHVWATAYITYLDTDALKRRKWLFLLPIPLSFLVAFRVHSHSPALFWTLLAYVAIYHFLKQQWGFIALYKARGKERSSFDYHLDKWTLWVGALGPVLLWHASPARQFDWFNAGEFKIVAIPTEFRADIMGIMAVFGGVYVARQCVHGLNGSFNVGKNLWMASAWISWGVGIGLSGHPLISAAFLNLFHGIPFLVLVWYRCNRRWEGEQGGPSGVLAWLSQRRNWIWFYALILVLAVAEEALWDGVVWGVYLPSIFGSEGGALSASALSVWVAILSVPQIVHYFLDAWVWTFDESNPDLRQIFDV